MFEVGEKVICIHDAPFLLLDDFVFSSKGITINKEYTVMRTFSSDNSILIINDANSRVKCENKLFARKTEYRRMKIDKIKTKLNEKHDYRRWRLW